jgi:hypothetical protein
MSKTVRERRKLWSVVILVMAVSCKLPPYCSRPDPKDASVIDAPRPGGSPAGQYSAQCSGWFPDWLWLANRAPTAGQRSFQLSQGYPLGLPVIEDGPDGKPRIVRYDPYAPITSVTEAPWLAFRFDVPAEQAQYLEALKAYMLEGNVGAADVEDDFDVGNNPKRLWYHVPMMTTKPHARREPHHGLTKERALRANQHGWIKNSDSNGLRTFAVGAYNWLGGYTIGKVFRDPNPQLADPAAAKFIPGALVFKLLFAEYAPASIEAGDPLAGSPEWKIQDVDASSAAQLPVRLVQVDIAVRDARAAKTGWVFATFVYDKTIAAASPWAKLRAVGLQWGDDAGVTTPGGIVESWINPAVPSVYQREDGLAFGRSGRLNGPVDNPVSSCISCHGTAQIVAGETNAGRARGVELVPPDGPAPGPDCTAAQELFWFHDVAAGSPFGVMDNNGGGCSLLSPQPASLHGLDYSLQLADALESSLAFRNPNPCAALAEPLKKVATVEPVGGDAKAKETAREAFRSPTLRELGATRLRAMSADVVRTQLRAVAPTAKLLAAENPTGESAGSSASSGEDPHQR